MPVWYGDGEVVFIFPLIRFPILIAPRLRLFLNDAPSICPTKKNKIVYI